MLAPPSGDLRPVVAVTPAPPAARPARACAAETCDLRCTRESIEACADGDGCCPAGCNNASDGDCSASWGDGNVLDPGSLAALEVEIGRQALMIGYVDVFYLCTLTSLLALPLVLLLGERRRPR